jgi:7-cyano-7-deazaguanine synthase
LPPRVHRRLRAHGQPCNQSRCGGAQKLKIHAPLSKLTKADIVKAGTALGVDYSITSSCYDPDAKGSPCGRCDACLLRAKGFAEAGMPDPLLVRLQQ